MQRFAECDLLGLRFAINIFFGTTVLWLLMHVVRAGSDLGDQLHDRRERAQSTRGAEIFSGTAAQRRVGASPAW